MWEQMELPLFVDEPETNIYFARCLQSDGLVGVGHFVSVLDKDEILVGQVMVVKDGQLFVIEDAAVNEQISYKDCLVEVTKTSQNLEQFLIEKLQGGCDDLEHLFNK